jgi:cytochrome c biogenesis protein CcmG, thiol:disulfide interchange protein DsbE
MEGTVYEFRIMFHSVISLERFMLKDRLLLIIPLLFLIVLGSVLWRGLSLNPQELPSPFVNKPLPAFALPDLLKPQQTFSDSDIKGQVALLNVWATWCISCRVEHPVLVDIVNQQNIPIYGLDYKDTRMTASKWLHQFGNPYRAVGFDHDGKIAINLGVYGTPETFIIDQHGIIRYKHIGPITENVWHTEIYSEIKQLENR